MNETIALLDHWDGIEKSAGVLIKPTPVDSMAGLRALMENPKLRRQIQDLSLINLQLKAIIDSGNKPGFLYWVQRSELLTDEEKRMIQRRTEEATDINIFALCNEAVEQKARGYEQMARNVEARRALGPL